MKKIDLTTFSDNELSLQVYNDEAFYNIRLESWFLDFIKDHFIFTPIQYEVLITDLTEEQE